MAHSPDAPPEGLPDYLQPVRCLGEGGMGSVWSVTDQRTGKIGALKAIRSGLLTEKPIVRRFEREMRTIAALSHQYIVQILDVGRLLNGAPYMLMEQIDGVPLIDLDLRGKSLGELIRLFDRILDALAYAHARRIIHRDLKPDNVLVYTDELGEMIPKLMDFGLAMVAVRGQLATRLTADGMVVGTPAYMAPEQACDEHHKICPATDLYAFGCMLYELLCGAPPHVAASPMSLLLAHATKPPRPFVPLDTIPDARRLEQLVMRLLEKDPSDRFELAADVRAELRDSGLLDSEQDVESEQIGSYGDTVLGMSVPDELTTGEEHVRRDESDDVVHRVPASMSSASEARSQVSVLNLREPELVGRHEARNVLQRYVEDVRRASQTAICLVSGPSGIGKTRLVTWLGEDGETRGALRYLAVNVSRGSSASLSILLAVVDHLRLKGLSQSQCEQALLRFFDTDDAEDWRVSGFRTLVSKTQGKTSSMGSIMGQLDLLLYAALEQLASNRPLVMWLDDTHSVPPTQIKKLVASLGARQKSQPAPMLVIVIDRADSEFPSDLELAVGQLEQIWLRKGIHLRALTEREMTELTNDGLNLEPGLASHVVRLADGLPVLAVALARQWHAAGLLESTPQGFMSRIDHPKLPVPKAVHSVLLSQLELAFSGMDKEMWRPVAELAAVLGRTFTLDWLEVGMPAIPKRIAAIESSRFLETVLSEGIVRSTSGDNSYEYSSGLMREGLLATMSSDRLTDLNRAAAQAKMHGADQRPGAYVEIANHLLAGRAFDKAYQAFVSAARRAIAQGRYDDASEHLDASQAAIAAQEGVSGPWDRRVATVWELELGVALARGELEAAQERVDWLKHAAGRLGDPSWEARTFLGQAQVYAARGMTEDARRSLTSGHEIIEELEDSEEILAELLLEEANLGDVDAAEEALELARNLGDPSLLGRALVHKGRKTAEKNVYKARDQLTEALAAARDAAELRTEAMALSALAQVAREMDDLQQAEKLLLSASRCYEAIDAIDDVADIHRRLADLARELGRDDDARAHERWIELIS